MYHDVERLSIVTDQLKNTVRIVMRQSTALLTFLPTAPKVSLSIISRWASTRIPWFLWVKSRHKNPSPSSRANYISQCALCPDNLVQNIHPSLSPFGSTL